MSNTTRIGIIVFIGLLLTIVASLLGIGSTKIQDCNPNNPDCVLLPQQPDNPGGTNILTALGTFFGFIIRMGSFWFKLATFQLDIPVIFSILLLTPIAAILIYIGFKLIRGGG